MTEGRRYPAVAPSASARARTLRTAGYNDGLADRPPARRGDPDYMGSYRRGLEERSRLRETRPAGEEEVA